MSIHREILRHVLALNLSGNDTHAVLNVSRGSVQTCVRRAAETDLTWADVESLSDSDLAALLFPEKAAKDKVAVDSAIDWERVYAELKRKGVKLKLLYAERVESEGLQLSYSQFCRQFKKWTAAQKISMRQEHTAGEKLFVDFSGMTADLTNPETGEVTKVQIFVATLGASNYTYFEAVPSQKLQDWIECHVRAFKFFGGVTKYLISDNLKSAVIDAEQFDPILNPTYKRFAAHYRTIVKPARPFKPKDKAKVEKGVQVTENKALAPLRNRTFFTLAALNKELEILRDEANNAPFQKLTGTRASWFEAIDRPALKPLPAQIFEFEEWITGYRVPADYYVNVKGHLYSVPYTYAHKLVDIRFTKTFVEILHGNTRIGSHIRNWAVGEVTTADEHLAPTHALYKGLTPEYFLSEGEAIGPNTKIVIDTLLRSKIYPQLSFSECFGIVKTLKGKFGNEEVELACIQAIRLQSIGYRIIKNILHGGVRSLPEQLTLRIGNIQHENLRGSDYYH